MALTEHIVYDKITVVQPYAGVNVRKATIIKKDGVEMEGQKSFERYALAIGYFNESDVFVKTDISNEPPEVQAICNGVWTDEAVEEWKTYLKNN